MPTYHPPEFVDNTPEDRLLSAVLRGLIRSGEGEAAFASGYFDLEAWILLDEVLKQLSSFRLLLGREPNVASPAIERLDLRRLYPTEPMGAGERSPGDALRESLASRPLDERHCRVVDDLLGFLCRDEVAVRVFRNGFLHAKAYLFPHHGIVGSSNFTRAGLTGNAELNVVSQSASQVRELWGWFEARWTQADDYKADLVAALEESKFGQPRTPFEVFIKALYDRFRGRIHPLEGAEAAVVDLAKFQEEGLADALVLLERHGGALIADAVGLGKTYIALRIMEHDLIGGRRRRRIPKGLLVCPAQLRDTMWRRCLDEYRIPIDVRSQEELGQSDFPWKAFRNHDLVVVDESHNFRSPGTNRYLNLSRLLRAGNPRKRVVLLTATPINNTLWDLYHQLLLLSRGSDTHYRDVGVANLNGFFRQVDRGETDIFELLEATTVRRGRADVRQRQEAGERLVIAGEEVRFPERELRNIGYNLTAAYPGVYHEIVANVERLHFAAYNIEQYRLQPDDQSRQIVDRGEALIGIQKTLFLKRLESSVHAFRTTVRRQQAFQRRFCEQLAQGHLLSARDHRRLQALERRMASLEAEGDTAADLEDEVAALLGQLEPVPTQEYDLPAIERDCDEDIRSLDDIVDWVDIAAGEADAKCERLKEALAGELHGRKVLVFSYFEDTAAHVHQQLVRDPAWRERAGNPTIERITGATPTAERLALLRRFAPVSNTEETETDTRAALQQHKVDILVATDVFSEGQNLQDAGVVINYDLHWNPVRMIQRAGRIDRLRALHDPVWIYNFFPEAELEDLLQLVARVQSRLLTMDRAGFLDSSTLGEAVTARSLDTIRRIRARDRDILDELERQQELASADEMKRPLLAGLQEMGEAELQRIPPGIHSGRLSSVKGVFVGLRAGERPFWRFYHQDGSVEREARRIFEWIRCTRDTECVMPTLASRDRERFRGEMLGVVGRAVSDLADELLRQRGLKKVPPQMTGQNRRLFDALNADDLAAGIDVEVRERVNEVLRHVPLRPFARDPELRAIEGLQRGGGEAQELIERLDAFFAEQDLYGAVTSPSRGEAIRREDIVLVCYEVLH